MDDTHDFYDDYDYYSKSQNLYQEELDAKDMALGATVMVLASLSAGAILVLAAKSLIGKILHK